MYDLGMPCYHFDRFILDPDLTIVISVLSIPTIDYHSGILFTIFCTNIFLCYF